MNDDDFKPTDQQKVIISHPGSAFISACPGAGKTRVLIERARTLMRDERRGRAIAFLSFTNAAVDELERRLRQSGLLPSPPFPNFIGTFDSFLWSFLISPFGVSGCATAPRLIADKRTRTVRPYANAQPLTLELFDRTTGLIIEKRARRVGYDPARSQSLTKAYETLAVQNRADLLASGQLDFDDVREIAIARLEDRTLSPILARVLDARFREVIVDEAQDCNPTDLKIIDWFRRAGISTKVICDPHQSIYQFRGGVTDHLFKFAETFPEADRIPLNGNFRSSLHICKAVSALRGQNEKEQEDDALGKHRNEPQPVRILVYTGEVPAAIGREFSTFTKSLGIAVGACPVLAATRKSGAKAIGLPTEVAKLNLTTQLALDVMNFHYAKGTGELKAALEALHRIVLKIGGYLEEKTYHQHLADQGKQSANWKPRVLQIANALRYDASAFADATAWHARAKELLAPYLAPGTGTINQKLPRNDSLPTVLVQRPASLPPVRTIHAVKGLEFPAVCVVLTSANAKGILDYLETGQSDEHAEDAREVYVGASRAQRALVLAVPKSQSIRLKDHLEKSGAAVEIVYI